MLKMCQLACLLAIVGITRRLLTNWSFGWVSKNNASYIRPASTQPSTTGTWKCSSSCCRYLLYVQSRISGVISWHSRKICRPAFYWRYQRWRRSAATTQRQVDVKKDKVVPLRVFNVSDEVCILADETVVALAKPVVDVTLPKPDCLWSSP